MTKEYEKLLAKIPKKDRVRIEKVLLCLQERDFSTLDRQKLKGYEHIFRIRVGNYRIIYFDDGERVILKAIQRRNEATYHAF